MSVYSESRGADPINWNTRLNAIIDTINWNTRLNAIIDTSKETPSESEIGKWKNESESWVTCAVGNACDVIPRCEKGRPYDEELAELGVKFYHNMKKVYESSHYNRPEGVILGAAMARKTLSKIEARISELIEQVNSES